MHHFVRLVFLLSLAVAGKIVAQEAAPATPPSATAPGGTNVGPKVMSASPAAEDMALQLDATTKKYLAKPGDETCEFKVRVKNVSDADVTVLRVRTSCGCTVARLPSQPWTLHAGENGEFQLEVDLRGKSGTLVKTATIDTQTGFKQVTLIIEIPVALEMAANAERRKTGVAMATADRQAVFKGDCARCHADPTRGLKGEALYLTACGVCHDAEHRATMVPDLRALPHATNAEFWLMSIAMGKPGTLMPAFAEADGGPLSTEQIDSLADYLTRTFSPKHPSAPLPPAPAAGEKK